MERIYSLKESESVPEKLEYEFDSLAAIPLEVLALACEAALDKKSGKKMVREHYERRMDAIKSGDYSLGLSV